MIDMEKYLTQPNSMEMYGELLEKFIDHDGYTINEMIEYLLELKWWDWPEEKIFENLEILCSKDIEQIKEI